MANGTRSSRRSLTLFNKHAGTKFDTKLASLDALDAIKLKPARVCPLICEHGFRPDGDQCSRIVCAEGSFLNDDNECEKRRARTPSARREPVERPTRPAAAGNGRSLRLAWPGRRHRARSSATTFSADRSRGDVILSSGQPKKAGQRAAAATCRSVHEVSRASRCGRFAFAGPIGWE